MISTLGCAVLPGGLSDFYASGHVSGILEPEPGPRPHGTPLFAYLEALDSRASTPAKATSAAVAVRNGQLSALVVPGRPFHFQNHDSSHHELFTAGERPIRLAVPAGERSESATPIAPALLRFFCALHPTESGEVLVANAAYHTLVHSDRFELSGIRAGEYWLHVRGSGFEYAPRRVHMRRGRSLELQLAPELP